MADTENSSFAITNEGKFPWPVFVTGLFTDSFMTIWKKSTTKLLFIMHGRVGKEKDCLALLNEYRVL